MSEPSVLANLTPSASVLSPDRGRVATFDREGRMLYYFRHGETFKRSLGSQVHLRFRSPKRQRRKLSEPETKMIFEEVHALAQELASKTDGESRRRLTAEILPWNAARLAAESRRFAAAYKPIAILPPDQYLAVVLQATEGCSWNRCTFCNFYMDRPFQVRSVDGFAAHCKAVRDLMGRGLRLRRGLFLADGNALALSNRRLDPLLEVAQELFPGRPLYGFVDLYSGERRGVEGWRHLARKGLRRVYVGMETGSDEILELVNKPGSVSELECFVEDVKMAGLGVSLIVMIGLGGRRYRELHRRSTLESLSRMRLDSGDLVYLSPLVEHRDSAYTERRLEAGFEPLSDAEAERELSDMALRLRQGGLRVGRYDIREFVY